MERTRGRVGVALTAFVIRRDAGICWLCKHEGADAKDHVVALANGGADDASNMKAIHHSPCPVCRAKCNLAKGKSNRLIRVQERHPGALRAAVTSTASK